MELTPFRSFENLFDSMFDLQPQRLWEPIGRAALRGISQKMSVNIRETSDGYVVEADVPGVNREDLNVELAGNVLTITAERHERNSNDDQGGRVHYSEQHYGKIARTLTLPDDVSPDSHANCRYDNGVLTVQLTRDNRSSRRQLTIE